jgi:hypothetical protein
MEVLSGKSKYQVSREMNVSEQAIYRHTNDIPSINREEPAIRGKKLELLLQLMNEGYIRTKRNNVRELRELKMLLPMIHHTHIDEKTIFYLEGKNKLALESLMKTKRSRIISYQELKRISKAFDVELDTKEKQRLMRTKPKPVTPIIRKKEGGYLSSIQRSQTCLDDFKGKKPFLGKKQSQMDKKLQATISEILREIEDSLVEFYIPMYCN